MPDDEQDQPAFRIPPLWRHAARGETATLETLHAHVVYELEPKLNAALAEAAMARQEAAAQSARLDRAQESGQNSAVRLSERIAGVDRHVGLLRDAGNQHALAIATLRNTIDKLEDAVAQMPAPRLSVSNVQPRTTLIYKVQKLREHASALRKGPHTPETYEMIASSLQNIAAALARGG